MNTPPPPLPPFLLRWLGGISRRTPYFRGKWRLTEWLFHRWLKHRPWVETVPFSPTLKMKCNLWDEVQNGVWWCGESYEFKESRFLKRCLKPGMCFLDVGANVGYYSLLAADLVTPSGQIHAFEPVAAQYAALCANLKLNHLERIVANRLIVSQAAGQMSIHIGSRDNSGASSVGVSQGSGEMETVNAISLDEYIQQHSLRKVDAIKIDVEGHEASVLRGAAELLKVHRPILLVEIRERILRQSGSSAAEVYDLLSRAGYTPFAAGVDGGPRRVSAGTEGNLIIFNPATEFTFPPRSPTGLATAR